MKSVSPVLFLLRTGSYTLLDNVKWLNKLSARISGGALTRDKLAEMIVSDVVTLACATIKKNHMLGKRTAEIVDLGRSVFFAETHQQMKAGIAPFVELLIQSQGYSDISKMMAGRLSQLFEPCLNDHPLERILVALSQQDGGEGVLKLTLNNVLSGVTGGQMLAAPLMSAFKRAVLTRPDYHPTSFVHHAAAWKLHQYLRPDATQLPPPLSVRLLELNVGAYQACCRQLDKLYRALNIAQEEKNITALFPECLPLNLAIEGDMPPSAFAAVVIRALATGQNGALDAALEALPDPATRQSLRQQRDAILAFIGRLPEAEITAARTWSGELDQVSATLSVDRPPGEQLEAFMRNGFRVPIHHPALCGTVPVDEAFLAALQKGMVLTLTHPAESYTRKLGALGYQAIAGAKGLLVSEDPLNRQQREQLHLLSRMVDGNPMNLLAVTRYLNPDSLLASVGDKLLAQYDCGQPDCVKVDDLRLWLAKPAISFAVTRNETLTIDATLSWPIVKFGQRAEKASVPLSGPGSLSTTVKIRLYLHERGVAKQEVSLGATRVRLSETLSFAPEVNATKTTQGLTYIKGLAGTVSKMV